MTVNQLRKLTQGTRVRYRCPYGGGDTLGAVVMASPSAVAVNLSDGRRILIHPDSHEAEQQASHLSKTREQPKP